MRNQFLKGSNDYFHYQILSQILYSNLFDRFSRLYTYPLKIMESLRPRIKIITLIKGIRHL